MSLIANVNSIREFIEISPEAMFGGETYSDALDRDRLLPQLDRVRNFMLEQSDWLSLREISDQLGIPAQSVSARLRDLRKVKFGGYGVLRKRSVAGNGTWQYLVRS